jgi:hypothetical protein
MEPPIRIKLYGIFPITKRGYIAQLVVMAVLLVLLLIAWGRIPRTDDILHRLPAEYQLIVAFLRWIPWMVLGFALLITTEAFFVLRRFAREEASRRAGQSPRRPQP